jgi:hypothetical protein
MEANLLIDSRSALAIYRTDLFPTGTSTAHTWKISLNAPCRSGRISSR